MQDNFPGHRIPQSDAFTVIHKLKISLKFPDIWTALQSSTSPRASKEDSYTYIFP